MKRTIDNMLKMRELSIMAVAGCFLTMGTSAQACSGPLKPNLAAGLAPSMARLLTLAAKPAPAGVNAAEEKAGDPAQASAPSIVGLWETTYLQGGAQVDKGYEVWHSDGTEILIDIAPPATDNVCVGAWVQTGPLTYRLTHPSWTFDTNGNLTGTALIMNSITLGRDGNSFTGSFTVSTADVNGVSSGYFSGQLSANRIQPR